MRSKINYVVFFSGFLIGILFYFINLIINNSEISSIDPEPRELLRNVNYVILFSYAFLGAIFSLLFRLVIKSLKKG